MSAPKRRAGRPAAAKVDKQLADVLPAPLQAGMIQAAQVSKPIDPHPNSPPSESHSGLVEFGPGELEALAQDLDSIPFPTVPPSASTPAVVPSTPVATIPSIPGAPMKAKKRHDLVNPNDVKKHKPRFYFKKKGKRNLRFNHFESQLKGANGLIHAEFGTFLGQCMVALEKDLKEPRFWELQEMFQILGDIARRGEDPMIL